jgi:3-hydroxyacyl-[acyl-carrier-protein] dehydratase
VAEIRVSDCIGADHPSLPGHFPGHPIVPGVVLLDAVRVAALQALTPGVLVALPMIKFLQPVLPDQPFEIVLQPGADGRVAFRIEVGAVVAVQGSLRFTPA